jgi:DNA repair protein RecO
LAAGNFIAQVFDQLIDIESPDAGLYDELRSCLDSIDRGPSDNNGLVVRRTIWRLIDRLGFKPRLDKCARCASALHEKLVYSPLLGGAVCAKCAPGVDDGVEFDHAIVPELDKLLSDSGSDSPINETLDRPIARFIEATLFSHIGARLPADRFWRSINRLG